MEREDRFNLIFRDLKQEQSKENLKQTLFKIEDKLREMGYAPWAMDW